MPFNGMTRGTLTVALLTKQNPDGAASTRAFNTHDNTTITAGWDIQPATRYSFAAILPGDPPRMALLDDVYLPFIDAEKGHVAIATNSTERGVRYMTDKGIKFNPDGMKYNDKGKLNAAYLDIDLNGFTLHLLQKKFN
jgi:hypothetical protein